MARYKNQDRNGLFLPVILSEQIVPGSFAFALDYLVDHELDLSGLDARFRNDEVGASAYDPRVMLKIVLFAYSQGMLSSRAIARTCIHNVQFVALCGNSQPSHAHIAKFVSGMGEQIKTLFAQVLMTCDAQGLIGGDLFAIDGVKLPSNASKERSGTFEELLQRARRLERAADKIVELHQGLDYCAQEEPMDSRRQARIDALRREAARTREFISVSSETTGRKGIEIKTNVTDPDSGKMATGKGVIQGYAAQAAVDTGHQVIVATDVVGSVSEHGMLIPMIEQSRPYLRADTVIVADAGYHSKDNVQQLADLDIAALIADKHMRKRDERLAGQGRFKPAAPTLHNKATVELASVPKHFGLSDFQFKSPRLCICPAGKKLVGTGRVYPLANGQGQRIFRADATDCASCEFRSLCLRNPEQGTPRSIKISRKTSRRIAAKNETVNQQRAIDLMRQAIDTPSGRALYSRRIGTVEPVFANLRHNKGFSRFNLRGRDKVNTQWHLYCMVHNIEKLAASGWQKA
ncbi:IS1182 family transposase [Herbaspirillum camelliae]|uniref:IS1182 family transposase n=1 Tax=Herbaspirillum camelliae TaxID=1892903 RepID=UPI00094A0DF6|nr:IS1182 family transposase [Herbaspirillum camelliae]